MAKPIETAHILNQLTSSKDLGSFLKQYDTAMIQTSLTEELNRLLSKNNLSVSDLISGTQLSKSYLYKIFSGEKVPSRDKLLQLVFALNCTETEAKKLLQFGGHALLHPKFRRDAILILP